jgi:hypothetical protein
MGASYLGRGGRLGLLATSVLGVWWLIAAPAVFGQGMCHVSVEPTSGRVGTVFVVQGEGFGEPTIVTVLRNGTQVLETEVELQPRETGSWRLDVRGDAAGTWLVRAILPESECGDEVEFSVLPDTSTVGRPEPVLEPPPIAPLLMAGMLGVALTSLRALARYRR